MTAGIVCKRCGTETGTDDVSVRHSGSDPLQVSECPQCGSILRIGGHRW